MKHLTQYRSILCTVVILLATVVATQEVAGQAGPTVSVTVSPGSRNVPVGRSVSVAVIWKVETNLAGSATLSSQVGEFRVGTSTIIGTVPKVLSKPINFASGGGTATFTESVLVPRSIIFRAHKLGFSRLVYQRNFDDGSANDTGEITLNITGSGGGGFLINRVSLRFDDDSLIRMLARGEKAKVLADINFSGNGLLQAVWEIADPASTPGEPVFRPMRLARQQIMARQRVTLKSPQLPTGRVGIYLVRLRITDPATAFDTPVLHYFVRDETAEATKPPARIKPLMPKAGSSLTPETNFGWPSMPDAYAYQVELYREQSEPLSHPPVTGMLVPAQQLETPLSPLALQHTEPGKIYVWRVVAIGRDGVIIGESLLREIRTSE